MRCLPAQASAATCTARQCVIGQPVERTKIFKVQPARTTRQRHHVARASAEEAHLDDLLSDGEEEAHRDGDALAARSSSDTSFQPASDDPESRALAVALARVCWETKGEDILALHVAPLVYWTRYMVLATVFSRPQLGAILAKVEKEAADSFDRRPASSSGGRSEWELLDFGDVVVHVLTAQQREYYSLEAFYGAAEELDLPFVREGEKAGPAWETKM